MKKALVLGLGISGESARRFLKDQGYHVVCFDDRNGPSICANLRDFDLFVPSPGISRSHPFYQKAVEKGVEIAGEAELALRKINQMCVAITGTNGKTSLVAFLEHCLKSSKKKVKALGNVGTPISSYLKNPDHEDILLIELSSFQLETLHTKAFDVGVILNISEDHLDRYDDFEQYAKTKAHLQFCLKDGGNFFVHRDIDKELLQEPFETFVNNDEAAIHVLKYFGVSEREFAKSLKSFSKPAHRLEFVAEIDGVAYYNDSKATNVAAVLNALEKMPGKVILIAGGKDKGLNFASIEKYKEKICCLVAFGETREKIAKTLSSFFQVEVNKTMEKAVESAMKKAKPNETVLFSPGCSSMDEYENFSQRGDAFKRIVMRRSL